MKAPRWSTGLFLTILAVVFSIGLTFASVELPALLQSALVKVTPALDGDSHSDEAALFRTGLLIEHYHIRAVGYVCFGLMVLLVVLGFASGRRSLAGAGAAAMFLPVFAQFATVMFFLAGLGVLNALWLPVLDISSDAGRLGDIALLPYRFLVSLFARRGIDVHRPLVHLCIGTGLLLFLSGTLAWFDARRRGRNVADFWVYRFSRHPQYLGWIVWSYGMLIALQRVRYPKRSWGFSAGLPWLLSSMIIVGVALLEERRMRRLEGEAYERYRRRTPFLFPVPRFIAAAFSAPTRLLFGKGFPERKREIAVVLVLYTALLVVLSHHYARHWQYARANVSAGVARKEESRVRDLLGEFERTQNWRTRYRIADILAGIGEPAVDPLVELLESPDAQIREYAARALGRIGAPRAIGPLLDGLNDDEGSVRLAAVSALGRMRAGPAVGPLIGLLGSESGSLRYHAAVALGRIGSREAVHPLIAALNDEREFVRAAVTDALGAIGAEEAVEPLVAGLGGEEIHVRRSIVVTLLRIGSASAVPALKEALEDDDWEVRLYAARAMKKIARGE